MVRAGNHKMIRGPYRLAKETVSKLGSHARILGATHQHQPARTQGLHRVADVHSKEIQPSLQGSQGKTEGYQRKRRHMKPQTKRIRDNSIEPFVARLGDDPYNLGFIGRGEAAPAAG